VSNSNLATLSVQGINFLVPTERNSSRVEKEKSREKYSYRLNWGKKSWIITLLELIKIPFNPLKKEKDINNFLK